ncbi:ring-1,2-phenylacetyl-CoA epoxidase subunit PaaD [Kineosphaera limosa]|uniref:1,2-phenylacetyl-CoA epoxidase subunit PaaD n=1 Tax=Kineosphaera limosa TaxID=111564 RepID=UPI0012FB844F|nr:1,2-phenylacetyl-CoA epoxidase subunit PaaD [Kineosphaera limosa]NYE02834.1 ring-1,2-phenylacetyl-CoA epoxidase subunit PaaD [Kineosphaera limosa]
MSAVDVAPAAGEARSPVDDRLAAAVEQAIRDVPDPEIPVLTLDDLGIVREVRVDADSGTVDVTLTPTYSGCPATEVIAGDVARAITRHGLRPRVVTRLAPPWTTDWMSERGRIRLREFGIAPPAPGVATRGSRVQGLSLSVRQVACPRCGSESTEQIARFGSTPCKALRRCLDCREPFDEFKPL